jgi:ABC-type Fe3+-hydroxamate transport system substrate-binding protein
MISKAKAIRQLKHAQAKIDQRGYVYQYPKGHWSWATFDSPIGQNLRESGMIYPETNCKAQQFQMITW